MNAEPAGFVRRARPALGTLLEIGVARSTGNVTLDAAAHAAIERAFARVAALQAQLSRFDPASDIARFNALPAGASLVPAAATCEVLAAARTLFDATAGGFDISTGTAPSGWALVDGRLVKRDARALLDLGGIAKGYVVDRAVRCLIDAGVPAGWVNAGGDLRAFGDVELPIVLRDETQGGASAFARLADGAFATSRFGAGARSALAGWPRKDSAAHSAAHSGALAGAHVSVAAPQCLWADALTKVVALSGDAAHPLLARHGAVAWLH